MKKLQIFLFFFISAFTFAQDRTSPYLELSEKNANVPLKETYANVHIAGTIAHVKLTQVYQNLGTTPIEAKYVFPMATQAAVHKMDMTIGDRTVHAKVYEKNEAKRVYEKALSEGKRAAKLDQERVNIFQMSVGNLIPNDEVKIELYYTEMLIPTEGQYQFVFPGVVGPRFTGESSVGETVMGNPYTEKGIDAMFKYDLNVCLNAGMMIQNVESNTHKINVNYPTHESAEISLSSENENPSNRDFILEYGLRGNAIASGMLLYEHGDENFFAYVMEPPVKTKLDQIPPREYLFVVDVSGSMNGYPLDVSKKLMRNLLGNMRLTDSFNILLFASSTDSFKSSPVPANTQNIDAAIRFLSSDRSSAYGGGTRLINALNKAYTLPRMESSSSRSMVVITDGYVSVEKEAFELIGKNLDKANVFTFGIGSSVNRYLIEGMAKVSNSQSFIVTDMSQAHKEAGKFKKYIESPVLTQVKFKANGFDIYDVEPKSIPDVFASRPVIVYGKYKGSPKGTIVVTGYDGSGRFKETFNLSNAILSKENKALRYLWARKKIERLDDYRKSFREDTKQEVIALGLKYNLATQYTSFVAVDQEVVNGTGTRKVVKQPLPMPHRVGNSAVGAEASIKKKTVFKSSFTLEINAHKAWNISTERMIKMKLRAHYATIIKELLKKHQSVKVFFDDKGNIAKVMLKENGQWKENEAWKQKFANAVIKNIGVPSKYTLIIKN